jgi:diguanylate cyclase
MTLSTLSTPASASSLDGGVSGLSLPQAASALLNARIMIVDDDMMMSEIVQTYLEDAGYHDFVVSNDPRDALALVKSQDPAVLLLDLMMPGLSGFDVLKLIRAEADLRFLPVIVLTASTGGDAKLQALQLGATDFLSKPIDASELVLRVRNTLAYRQFHERSVNFDELTGLPTRKHFLRLADESGARPGKPGVRGQGVSALFSIALQGVKRGDELFGAGASSAMVQHAAGRVVHLTQALPALAPACAAVAHVGRVRSEQLAVAVGALADVEQVERFARELLRELSLPATVNGQQLALEPVLGIALAGPEAAGAASLLECAELARTQAAQRGPGHLEFYSPELNAQFIGRRHRANELARALDRQQLQLKYQPKVDMNSGEISGVEALLHWVHPEFGTQIHAEFRPLAQDLGLEEALGDWALIEACASAARWRAQGLEFGRVAVNIQAEPVARGRLAQTLERALQRSGLPGERLMLEFSQGSLDAGDEGSVALLACMQAHGVGLCLDHFGAGGSTLAQVRNLPVSEIKVDASFVRGLAEHTADRAIVAAAIVLGHHLGVQVVALGVDHTDQLFVLHDLACDVQQGELFSPLLPETELVALLRRSGRDH